MFYRRDVQNQGVGKALFPLKTLGENPFHAFLLVPSVASDL